MEIPKWLNGYLSAQDLKKIEEQVLTAEQKTIGEVVPIVVRRSSTVGHIPVILLFALSLLFFVFDGDHIQTAYIPLPHWVLILFDFIILLILVRVLSPLSFVERLLTPRDDQAAQVEQRAINEFYNHRVHHTDRATGILVFVSLMEHRAVVLGDEAIATKIPGDTWQKVVDRLIEGVKNKNLADGFTDAIEMSGIILAEHFPDGGNTADQLKNHLIIKE